MVTGSDTEPARYHTRRTPLVVGRVILPWVTTTIIKGYKIRRWIRIYMSVYIYIYIYIYITII